MPKLTMLPIPIKAKTPEELTLAMLENNLKYQKFFQYFDIQKQDGQWVAWFLDDLTDVKRMKNANA